MEMDVLKLPLPQDSVTGNIGVAEHGGEAAASANVAIYSTLSTKPTSNTPRKRAINKTQDMTRTPPQVNPAVKGSWTSSSTPPKPEAKSRSSNVKAST